MNNDYELMIINRGQAYFPSVIEPIVWEDELRGSPSKVTFTIIKGQKLNFQEGNPVRFKYNDEEIFFGFVFTKKRDREHHIEVTCYDQIRYLKNKDTMLFENKSLSEMVKQIGGIHPSLNLGDIDDTGLKIKSLLCDNESYLDMIYKGIDHTITYKKKMYVLYDDFGKLCLKDIDNLKIDGFLISDENMENFDYKSSIDEETYNQIKLVYENEETGKREVYLTKDTNSINNWGLLQYYETIDENTNGKVKADVLLELYNKKTRSLTVKGVRGNPKVRGGFRVMVMLNVGDIILQNYLIVSSVKHTFDESHHTMDITFIGGGFSA